MTVLHATVVFMLIGACAAQKCFGGELLKGGLSSDLQERILHLHNTLRDKVAGGIIAAQPMAENMKEMIWDEELASKAQNWANTCVFQHESPRTNRKGQLYGQNLSHRDKTWSSDEGEWEVLSKMIAQWFDEVYKPQNSLHFSQMVWANTHKIGCGYSEYKSNEKVIALFVCNYFPSGNIIGTEPYKYGARSCEKHGLYASRFFRNLCAADDEDGPNNLYPIRQYYSTSPQQWGSGQYRHMSERAYPLQLLGSQFQRVVHHEPTTHQFAVTGYPSVGPLQGQTYQVPLGKYHTHAIRGAQPIDQSQQWGVQDQYSPSTFLQRQAQPIQYLQGNYQGQSQSQNSPQYQVNNVRVSSAEQPQSWNYQYLPSYQQPQNQASVWLHYQYLPTNPVNSVPQSPKRSDIQNLSTNSQSPQSIPDYERILQSKMPGYQASSTYQNYPGQYQPSNLNGYSWQYQTSPVQGEGVAVRTDGALGWPSGYSSTLGNGPTGAGRGNDNLQWFNVGNPVSVSSSPQTGNYGYVFQPSYTVSGPQVGYTTGLNGVFNTPLNTQFTYGNTVQPIISTALPPMFGFQGLLDPRLVAQYQTPYYPSALPKPTGSSYASFATPFLVNGAPGSQNDKLMNKLKKMRKH